MSVTLKVKLASGAMKAMRFTTEMSMDEIARQIHEKTKEGGEDHGIFQPPSDDAPNGKWLQGDKTIMHYDLSQDEIVEYKKRHRAQKIRLLDDTVKTVLVDESTTIAEIVANISKKMNINNPEEYSLQRVNKDQAKEKDKKDDKKDATAQLMVSEEGWLKNTTILGELGIEPDELLVFKKKFFFNDQNLDRSDSVQVHFLYVQCRDAIIEGKYPTNKDEAVMLAAIQCQITKGDYSSSRDTGNWINLKEYLAPEYQKIKGIDKEVAKEYKKLVNMSEVNAKYRYVQLCRSLKTYGITMFAVKMKSPEKKGKLKDVLFGVTRESVLFVDAETKEVEKTYKLTKIKRWAAADKSITFDFGDYANEYTTIISPQADAIAQLMSGYVDIILKARKDVAKAAKPVEDAVATEERVAVKRGVAGQAASYSTTTFSGSTSEQRVRVAPSGPAPSQQVAITDLKSAHHATELLLAEIDAYIALPPIPDTAGHSVTTLTPQQYKNQLIAHSSSVAQVAATMLNDIQNPPAGGIQAIRTSMTAHAQQLMSNMLVLGKNAQNAVFLDDLQDESMDIVNASQKLANSISKMLKVSVSAVDGDPAALEAFRREVITTQAASMWMTSAVEVGLANKQSTSIMVETGKGASQAIRILADFAKAQKYTIQEVSLQAEVATALTRVMDSMEHLSINTEVLSAISAHPEVRKKIVELSSEAGNSVNALLSVFKKTNSVPSGALQAIISKAQDAQDAIAILSSSADVTDQKSYAPKNPDGTELIAEESLADEFFSASNALTSSFTQLRSSAGNPELLQESFKSVMSSTNKLVSCCRAVAAQADPTTQGRLLTAAKAAFDASANLAKAVKISSETPEDSSLQAKVLDSASHLQTVAQTMVADAGKIATVTSLDHGSMQMVADISNLVSAARAVAVTLPEANANLLLKGCKEAMEALPKLITCLKRLHADPNSDKAQVDLLDQAQRAALPPMNLVAGAKRLAPKVSDPNLKQLLTISSDTASSSVQLLMASCETFKQIGGHVEIEEALEAFAANLADLETAEIAAAGGFLDTLPGQTRENSLELLAVSIKSLHQANAGLAEIARTKPTDLGNAVKACTAAASQVGMACKAVAATTPGKPAQKKLLSIAKQLSQEMEQLVRASRGLASSRDDPSSELLMDSASQDVAAVLATLVGSSVAIDSKELDEASASVAAEMSKIGPTLPSAGSTFASCVEDLESAMKAVNAAVLQVVGMARSKNLKGLGSAAKITAATIPTATAAANNAAATCENEVMAESIRSSAAHLCQQVITLFDFAKARVANSKDPVYDQNLLQANKMVTDAATKLMRSLGSASNKECEDAVDAIMQSAQKLETTEIQLVEATELLPGSIEAKHQAGLQALSQHARTIGNLSGLLVSAAHLSSENLGEYSKQSAEEIEKLMQSARTVFNSTACSVPPAMLTPSKQIIEAAASLLSAGGNIPQIISSARTVSVATGQLLSAAKDRATTLGEGRPVLQETIAQASQKLASATGNLAKAARAVASKAPDAAFLMSTAIKELQSATKDVLISSSVPVENGVSPDDFDKLIAASRSVATASSRLISASAAASAKPKDPDVQQQLADAQIAVSQSIKELLKSSANMMPGVVECDEATEAVQRSIGEITATSLAVAIGNLDAKQGTKPVEQCQEEMVDIARGVSNGITSLVRASRQSPEAIGKSAKMIATLIPQLASIAKAAVAATKDTDSQNNTLDLTKALADNILKLTQAAQAASSNPSKETYTEISARAEEASSAIGNLVASLSSGVSLVKDIDDAVDRVNKTTVGFEAVQALDATTSSSIGGLEEITRGYSEFKDELIDVSKDMALMMRNIVSLDKSNLVQVSNALKEVADTVPRMISAAKATANHTSNPHIKSALLAQSRALSQFCANLAKGTKMLTQNKTSAAAATEVSASFRSATESLGKMISAAKEGAVGEILSDAAVEGIKKTVNDIEATLLFAAAGQLEVQEGTDVESSGVTGSNFAAAQRDLFSACKALVVVSSQLVGSTKGTQEQFGDASSRVSNAVLRVTQATKAIASLFSDIDTQQGLLSAGKALSIASQQLVLAGKDAQRFKKDPTASRSLGKASEGLAEAIGQIITGSHSAVEEANRGVREMDKAHTFISTLSSQYDNPNEIKANPDANAELLTSMARAVADASVQLVSSFHSNQDDLVKASNNLSVVTSNFLQMAKGAMKVIESNNDAASLQNKLKLATSSKSLPANILTLITKIKEEASGNKSAGVPAAVRAVTDLVREIYAVSRAMPGGSELKEEDDMLDNSKSAEDLEEIAESELLAAAKSIEASVAALLASKAAISAPSQKGGIKVSLAADVATTIVDASGAIANAVSKLVGAAARSQSKRVQDVKKGKNQIARDPMWNNGLISAAKTVAAATQQMVKFAADASLGKADEEEMIAVARQVAAATAQLVAASRARSGEDPEGHQLLSGAAKAVAAATSQLVSAAKAATAMKEQEKVVEEDSEEYNFTGAKVKELEQQMKILRLEKELNSARNAMLKSRKAKYQEK